MDKTDTEVIDGITRLLNLLKDDDLKVREDAILDLGRMKANDGRVVPALMKTLRSDFGNVRKAAVKAITQISCSDESAITDMLEVISRDLFPREDEEGDELELGEEDAEERECLIETIVQGFVTMREDALPTLLSMLGNDNEASDIAKRSIETIGGPAVLPVIRRLMGQKWGVLQDASRILNAINPKPKSVEIPVPEVIGPRSIEAHYGIVLELKWRLEEVEEIRKAIKLAIDTVVEIPL